MAIGNRQRKGGDGQEGKTAEKSKKPPPNEKSGDLEEDIRGIEQEFGGIFGKIPTLPRFVFLIVNTFLAICRVIPWKESRPLDKGPASYKMIII